jgi:hypothetical protein
MAFRVNYNQQRGDRERAKQQKKKERLARRDEDAQKRRAEREGLGGSADAAPEAEGMGAGAPVTPKEGS